MTAASRATIVVGFSLAGPTCFAITRFHRAVQGGRILSFFIAERGLADGLELAAVLPDRPGDAGELVGERDRCLVVLDSSFEGEGPGPEPIVLGRLLRVTEDRARAVDQEHPEVGVSTSWRSVRAAASTAGVLPGGEPEVAREVPA